MSTQSKSVDLADIVAIVRRRKWLVLIPWILVSIIVAGGSFLLTPMYRSFTIISVDPNISLSTDLKRYLGMDNNSRDQSGRGDELKSVFNEVTSSSYVKQVGDQLGLLQNQSLTESARKLAAGQAGANVDDIKIDLLQARLQNQITVDYAASDQIRIYVQSSSAQETKDIANAVGAIYVSERLKRDIASVRSSSEFSDIQLQKYQSLVEQKTREKTNFEAKMMGNQQDAAIVSEANRRDVQSEIDRTTDDIAEMERTDKDILTQLQNTVKEPLDKLTLKDSDDNNRSKAELTQQVQALSDMATKYPWTDPQILNNKLRQDALLRRIALENRRLVNEQYSSYSDTNRALLATLFTNKIDLDHAYSKKSNLIASLDELKEKLRLIPEYKTTLERMQREIDNATQLRDRFRAQQENSSISQDLLGDNSMPKYKVIEPAKLPLKPFSPNRAKIIGLGILMGLVVGGAALLLAELTDKSFKNVDDVEQFLSLPVIGVAPHIEFIKEVTK
jgi:polysaccharide biosynthesis transport protein